MATIKKVTPIIRIIFFLWLVVSIVLVGSTIATLLPLSDRSHEHRRNWDQALLLRLTPTVSTAQVRRAGTEL